VSAKKVRLTLVDERGKILGRPRVQLGVTVEEFINDAIKHLNLPRKTPEGVKIDYQLIVNGKPIIDPLKKFEDLKISDGAKVILSKKLVKEKPMGFEKITREKVMINRRRFAIIALMFLLIGLLIGSSVSTLQSNQATITITLITTTTETRIIEVTYSKMYTHYVTITQPTLLKQTLTETRMVTTTFLLKGRLSDSEINYLNLLSELVFEARLIIYKASTLLFSYLSGETAPGEAIETLRGYLNDLSKLRERILSVDPPSRFSKAHNRFIHLIEDLQGSLKIYIELIDAGDRKALLKNLEYLSNHYEELSHILCDMIISEIIHQ